MNEKLKFVLERIDSRHLASLWTFYRDYFTSDENCLDFIFQAIDREPVYSKDQLEEKFLNAFNDDNYIDPDEHFFIPRRMLNCVERMVSTARDMEQIRRGKDVFKIVFLVTCVETLQKLSGKDGYKKEALFDFFIKHTPEKDKEYIRDHFKRDAYELQPDEDPFWQFISVLNEYRNAATHESEYWDYCFKNYDGNTPLSLIAKAQIDGNSAKAEHLFETSLSYRNFEKIFVRTCISFIREYVSKQEDTPHADT